MAERLDTNFILDESDVVRVYEPSLSDGDDGFPPEAGDEDEDEGRPDRITVTYSGKAVEEIIKESERLGITTGDFLRKCLKLGVISARAGRNEIHGFRFDTFFHEDDLYQTD